VQHVLIVILTGKPIKVKYQSVYEYIQILCLTCVMCTAWSQTESAFTQGTITYMSSRNVYIKFTSTKDIVPGDTLWVITTGGAMQPALLVTGKSSTSVVSSPLGNIPLAVGQSCSARIKATIPDPSKDKGAAQQDVPNQNIPSVKDSALVKPENVGQASVVRKEKVRGRVSAADYITSQANNVAHRWRYVFSMNGDNWGGSRFSTEHYITFRHKSGEWYKVRDNLADALKVYSLAVRYEINESMQLSLGRKINSRISSMGAIDGLQAEKKWHNFLGGAILGFRPDYQDYGFNANLFQTGVYAGYIHPDVRFNLQTVAGFIEQKNTGRTDRRFVYLQHTNTLLKNLNIFSSAELDLYQNIGGIETHDVTMTNLLVSLRYRMSRALNITASYDNRKNVVYYETNKNFIDSLYENESRQGLRCGLTHRITPSLSWGVNAGYRFQNDGRNESKNLNGYINYSNIPGIKVNASLTFNMLQTSFIQNQMYGIRLSREIVPGKLQSELWYRRSQSTYPGEGDYSDRQDYAGIDLGWYFWKKLSLHCYYEGAFQKSQDVLHSINTSIIQRF
jgi:hypothetical protein